MRQLQKSNAYVYFCEQYKIKYFSTRNYLINELKTGHYITILVQDNSIFKWKLYTAYWLLLHPTKRDLFIAVLLEEEKNIFLMHLDIMTIGSKVCKFW